MPVQNLWLRCISQYARPAELFTHPAFLLSMIESLPYIQIHVIKILLKHTVVWQADYSEIDLITL